MLKKALEMLSCIKMEKDSVYIIPLYQTALNSLDILIDTPNAISPF